MSDLTFPPPSPENMELAAANRRLTTAILGMVLLTGLVACLAYLAGRTVTHIRAAGSAASSGAGRQEAAHGPLVVHPLPAKAAAAAESAAARQVTTPRAVLDVPGTAAAPEPGQYLQVGYIDPARDRSMAQRLSGSGFTVRLAPMEGSANFRVLVGPIESPEQQKEIEARLTAEGYRFFLRRY